MGKLYDLIQAHIDAQPYEVTPADIARRIGVSRQTVLNWKSPTKLVQKEHLEAIAAITGMPYLRVLDALLEDIGYIERPASANVSDLRAKVAGEQELRVAKRPPKKK